MFYKISKTKTYPAFSAAEIDMCLLLSLGVDFREFSVLTNYLLTVPKNEQKNIINHFNSMINSIFN